MNQWLNRCHFGDVRDVLRRMAAEGVKVQTCVTSPPYFGLRSYLPDDHAQKDLEIGAEQSPEQFIDNLVEVFHLVRHVLADDGTLWLNIGDSYSTRPNGSIGASGLQGGLSPHVATRTAHARRSGRMHEGYKHKDLMGIPWMLAFALRADGWYLRQEIIWHKPNPMPESVTDRCTKAHESLFLLTKRPSYYFDNDAIKEPALGIATGRAASFDRAGNLVSEHVLPGQSAAQHRERPQQLRARQLAEEGGLTQEHIDAIRAVGITDAGKAQHTQSGFRKNTAEVQALADHAKAVLGGYYREFLMAEDRNKRSVWTVATKPYSGAHFATFPTALIEPCVLAGAPAAGIVLDPFFGSGTTGQVAQQLGRNFIGIDINQANEPLQAERLRQPSLILE